MSIYRQKDGLFWPSLFLLENEKERKQAFRELRDRPVAYTGAGLAQEMLALADRGCWEVSPDDPCVQAACEHVALKFMLHDTHLAEEWLSEEELSKAHEVLARKQYNSKLLQSLLQNFLSLLVVRRDRSRLQNLFVIPLADELSRLREEELDRTCGVLKRTVERIASGVKSSCYYAAEHALSGFAAPLQESLNRFLADKTHYDFRKAHEQQATREMSTLFCNQEAVECNRLLQLALVNDADFWQAHTHFGVVDFLNAIARENDLRHAEKVLSFIADKLRSMPHMDMVFERNFPLWMSLYDPLVSRLEKQAFRFAFKRLEPYCDLTPVRVVTLCPPMSPADNTTLAVGRALWTRFIAEYNYPTEADAVNRFLETEVERFVRGETHADRDIAVILDAAPFRYAADSEDRRLFAAYHPDAFSCANIWNRVYRKAYAVTLLSSEDQERFSYLQRIFVDLIKAVEKQTGICTVHQLDESTRARQYQALKDRLREYGIEPHDDHTRDYIIALLDRDTARMEEAERFPALELIGDAIYGLAVAECLFYDPATERMPAAFEQYTRAEAQVAIAKKLGLDRLYLPIGLPAKYVECDALFFDYETADDERRQTLLREKYLADSLEMLLGALYGDIGLEPTLDFVKRLLRDTFPNRFRAEVHPTAEAKRDRDIDGDYWSRILPPPCSPMTAGQSTLWHALHKVILTVSLGTDNKRKRRFITNSLGNTAVYGEAHNHGLPWVFHAYLTDGLASALRDHGDVIRTYGQNNGIL